MILARPASVFLCLVPLFSCAGKSSSGSADQVQPPTEPKPAKTFCQSQAGDELPAFRQQILDRINGSSCRPGACSSETFTPKVGHANSDSLGQRILLIDDAVFLPALTRYRSRTLATLQLGTDGQYRNEVPAITVPNDAREILESVNAYPQTLPTECLDLGLPFLQKFGAELPQLAGHGMDIMPVLADMNPKAQFVVSESQFSELLTADAICPLLDESNDQAWTVLEQKMNTASASLQAAIRLYQINYVHLSWGLEGQGIRDEFKQCPGTRRPSALVVQGIQDRYAKLFGDLTQIATETERGPQDVLIFQAAASASYPLAAHDPNYSLDCRSIKGRIRTNAASYHGLDIEENGSLNLDILPNHERNGQACSDLYIVTGYVGLYDQAARTERFPSAPLGLGRLPSPSWPSASSFANPLGLSYFLYQRQTLPGESHSAVLERVTKKTGPSIYDPLRFKQFLLYQ